MLSFDSIDCWEWISNVLIDWLERRLQGWLTVGFVLGGDYPEGAAAWDGNGGRCSCRLAENLEQSTPGAVSTPVAVVFCLTWFHGYTKIKRHGCRNGHRNFHKGSRDGNVSVRQVRDLDRWLTTIEDATMPLSAWHVENTESGFCRL